MLTITEAAKKVGVSRAAIHKAIKTGRLSFTKDDKGNYLIEPSELARVYQPVDKENTPFINPSDYKLIEQKLEFTERLLWQTENERDRLAQVITMLSYQPVTQPQQPVNQATEGEKHQPVTEKVINQTGSTEAGSLYQKLFGKLK